MVGLDWETLGRVALGENDNIAATDDEEDKFISSKKRAGMQGLDTYSPPLKGSRKTAAGLR